MMQFLPMRYVRTGTVHSVFGGICMLRSVLAAGAP